jgi:hypothetical protein
MKRNSSGSGCHQHKPGLAGFKKDVFPREYRKRREREEGGQIKLGERNISYGR